MERSKLYSAYTRFESLYEEFGEAWKLARETCERLNKDHLTEHEVSEYRKVRSRAYHAYSRLMDGYEYIEVLEENAKPYDVFVMDKRSFKN